MRGRLLRYRLVLGLVALLFLTAGGAAWMFGWGTGTAPRDALLIVGPTAATPVAGTRSPASAAATPAAETLAASGVLTVYVTGAVQRPGVYTLRGGARVADLLPAAGGPSADADLEHINLAARLHDEEQITVPRLPAPGTPGASGLTLGAAAPGARTPPAANPVGPININTADASALASLPGIGPALAARILEYRAAHGPFPRPEAIQDVSGIGAKLFERIRNLIKTGP